VIQLSVLLVRSQQEVRVYINAILVPYKMVASMQKLYTSSRVYGARQTVYMSVVVVSQVAGYMALTLGD